MTIDQAKQIDIRRFLEICGARCSQNNPKDSWYFAPGRDERTASLHVFGNGTRWHDFGEGIGGDIVDLAKHLFNLSSTHDALAKITELTTGPSSFILPRKEKIDSGAKEQRQGRVISTGELSRDLLMYSRSRGIHDDVIMGMCRRVDFIVDKGKRLYAIGFRNDNGGWELRNSFYKGCLGCKSITSLIDLADAPVVVFEGFFDYMSCIELGWLPPSCHNAIVLNSVSQIDSAIPFLFSRQVILCLDNDSAGRSAAEKIKAKCQVIDDWSGRYPTCKDINEFLIK